MAPDPDPTLDPTFFFSDFFIFFSFESPAGTLSSALKVVFFAKILCQNFFASIFSVFSTLILYGKREGSGSIPLTNGSRSGSPTLSQTPQETELANRSKTPEILVLF